MFSASHPELIHPFTGLRPAQFHRLVCLAARRGGDAIADGRPGRPWALDLPDRVLLVAVYWRTNLTMRQLGPLFGISHSAVHRALDTVGPLLAMTPSRRRAKEQVVIVDGTLIPTRDHRLAAPSKNYRYSTNLQVAIDANTRLVTALGEPQPGNRNDTIAYRSSGINEHLAGRAVMADGGYRGNPEVIIPYRKPVDGSELPDWKQHYNTRHRKVRARVEHCLARLKTYKILRDYRRAARTLAVTAAGIAHLHNIALAS
ncbi:transposase [Couchioplanes caeruleus subsp. caeruleus]|uniref:Transposase n=1 Tax=Couchioplanes caeruleus subsp. caeruleus TaxID=56427 RepID=A0A1K0GPV9_9ACTN|nr:transposase [Couchioplanes caeruleus subsp. caeruleus]